MPDGGGQRRPTAANGTLDHDDHDDRPDPGWMTPREEDADLGYAVDVVLNCEGSTDANIRRVLAACQAAADDPDDVQQEFAAEQAGFLEEALAAPR